MQVQSKGATHEAAIKAATLAAEEAKAAPKGGREAEGESKCYRGHGVRQSPKAFVHPKDCRWPPTHFLTFAQRSVLTLDGDLQAGVVLITTPAISFSSLFCRIKCNHGLKGGS